MPTGVGAPSNPACRTAWHDKRSCATSSPSRSPPPAGALDDWLAYASRSKLAPFVKLARTIRRYRTSIEATIESRLTNGIAEFNNAAIGRTRTNARGFHDPQAFITMILLDRAGITPALPWATT